MSAGYVYILTNESMPGLVKIGKTTRCPDGRAGELDTTGVPTPFVVHHYEISPDCSALEKTMHDMMPDLRVRSGREFFRIEADAAAEMLGAALREQVEGWLAHFIPDSTIVADDEFVDIGGLHKSAYEVFRKYGLCPPEFVQVLYELRGDEIEAAVVRQQKNAAQRRKEYQEREAAEE